MKRQRFVRKAEVALKFFYNYILVIPSIKLPIYMAPEKLNQD